MKLFILVLLFPIFSLGASSKDCLLKMATDTATSEEKITVMLMECNNLFLDGQFKSSRRLMSAKNTVEKVDELLFYKACEDMSRAFTLYMNKCSEI